VKGKRFDSWRSVGVAAQAVRVYAARSVDELVLLDIAATEEGRGPDLVLISEFSEVLFTPITVGGGVRQVEDTRRLLHAGADKIAVNTAAVEVPDLVRKMSDKVGAQGIVVGIDAKRSPDGASWKVYTHGGRTATGLDAVEWAQQMNKAGAGEILLTSIDREGTLLGYDLDLIRAVSNAVDTLVVAHGGCGTYEHMHQALEAGAHAVAAGAMFQFTDQTPKGAAQYLAQHGVEVRL
jgi:cyclase